MRTLFHPSIFVFVITLGTYWFTTYSVTSPFGIQATLFLLFVITFVIYFLERKGAIMYQVKRLVMLLALFILFWVGSTGWFVSPFSFGLHLLMVMLSFFFPASVALGFAIALFTIIMTTIGQGDMTMKALEILSLLTSIPLTFYFRDKFLRFKEEQKMILILKRQHMEHENKVENVLNNTFTRFCAHLRSPLSQVRLLAYHMESIRDPGHMERERTKLIHAIEEALSQLAYFEEETTGEKLLKTLKRQEPSVHDHWE